MLSECLSSVVSGVAGEPVVESLEIGPSLR